MRVFGRLLPEISAAVNENRSAITSAIWEPMETRSEIVAAVSDALYEAHFERLHALTDRYPDIKQTADDLEQAIREARQSNEQRRDEFAEWLQHIRTALPDLCLATPSAFDDPDFWSSFTPLGDQIRDAVQAGLREQKPPRSRVKRSVAGPLIAEHLVRATA